MTPAQKHDLARMLIGGVAGLALGYALGRLEQWTDSCINCIERRVAAGLPADG